MKNRISKILGIGLTLVLALALLAGFALPAHAAVEKINEWYKFSYPKEGADGKWFYSPDIYGMRELTQAINGDLYVYAEIEGNGTHEILKSTDGGRTWALTKYSDPDKGVEGDRVFDMVCSSIDKDIVYATDGYYVYKTTDGGDKWSFVAKGSLQTALMGDCTTPVAGWRRITSIDVTYDANDRPFVFIGTREYSAHPGSVYYIGEAGYPAQWTDLKLSCYGANYEAFAVGCAPDWADSKETFVVVSKATETHVLKNIGASCSWVKFAELWWDCDSTKDFGIWAASRIRFPDDWEDTETLFVGVTDKQICSGDPKTQGGDVYQVTKDAAIDLNVKGITTGCKGIGSVDIISLDVKGDTDEAELIAGAFCDNKVYYSTDGGWSWDVSEKSPTGEKWTYVIWYKNSALAATWGCESAVSMSCGEEVGQYWNQISLIATDIESVLYIDHSPGYVCEDSETMFMLTWGGCASTSSLFRHNGKYWERVFSSTIAGWDDGPFTRVRVSPDFNTTNAVFVTNQYFEIWRSLDAGCSWKKLTFPCKPRPDISAAVVIDEDTVIAGGRDDDAGWVFKTTRHGTRPWKKYEVTGASNANFFALEPGYEDPDSILLGDDESQVFISEDGGETWALVGEALNDNGYETWVIFDPGYATNRFIYAAAGEIIARCKVDPAEDWEDQEWEEITCENGLYEAAGIAIADGTALYIADSDGVGYDEDTKVIDAGGVLRSLNPDAKDKKDVVFERIGPGLKVTDGEDVELRHLWLTCDVSDKGCAENVLWSLEQYGANPENIWVYEDTLAAPVVLDMPVNEQKLTTVEQATLSWKALCGADCYEVALWSYCAECPDEKLAVDLGCLNCAPGETVACGPEIDCKYEGGCCPCTDDICIVVKDLDPGTKYYWQVRVCQGKPTLSKWSVERTFTTALLGVPFRDLCSPPCGAQDIILTPNFAWGTVKGATGYNIELATTETFTAGVIKGKSTVNAWVCPVTLEYATTYYWRVRAEKDGIYSAWTVCMFTTMAKPVAPTPPVEITPAPPAPQINIPPAQMITPNWIYAIIGIGAALCVGVIALIVRTRRPPA